MPAFGDLPGYPMITRRRRKSGRRESRAPFKKVQAEERGASGSIFEGKKKTEMDMRDGTLGSAEEVRGGRDTTRVTTADYSSSSSSSNTPTYWYVGSCRISRSAAVYISQMTILYIAIITCFVNLTVRNGPNELWISLLSLSLGAILPAPKVRKPRPTTSSPIALDGSRYV